MVGSGEVSKNLLKRKDACEGFNFLRDVEFRLHEGAGQAAAWSAAATVMPGDEVSKHAAAAFEDLGDFALAGAATAEEYNLNFLHGVPNSHSWVADAATDLQGDLGWAGAATVEEFSVSPGMYNFNTLHGLPNSHGWVVDAATDLHENLLEGVFSLHAFGGHGGAASVLGDTGGAAFSCTDSLIHDSFANSSFHPIHACAHSCFDGRRAGFGVSGGGCALALVSFLSDVADVPGDEDDACVDGVNSVIQGFEGHANACTSLDALHNSRWARGRFGFLMRVRSTSLIRSQKACMLRRGLMRNVLKRVPRSRGLWLGVLQCPFPLVFLISLLCYLGQVVKLESYLGWTQLEKTGESGVCFFRGAYQGEDFFSSLAVSGDWVKKGSYHTVWSVPGDSLCSCSYAYGHGPAIGSHTGKQCWELLSWLWRTIAPLMKPWCAEGEVPTAANLNLYRGGNSR